MPESASGAIETAALAKRLAGWLGRAGVAQTDLAVDVADLLAAARHVDALLIRLLSLDVTVPSEAERAAEAVGEMEVWLFTELKPHLENLEAGWEEIENAVFERLPEDDGREEQPHA